VGRKGWKTTPVLTGDLWGSCGKKLGKYSKLKPELPFEPSLEDGFVNPWNKEGPVENFARDQPPRAGAR